MADGLRPEEFALIEQQANAEAEKFDAPIRAGLEGVARGATFGLSDVALTALGDDEFDEGVRKRKEFNPIADVAGQAIGTVGSVLLMPGIGLTGAAAKAGKLAEGAVAKALVDTAAKSTAKKILANATAKGLGSAIEGAFYGAGQVVSEAALGDPKQAAENALSTIGLSSLLSGGLVGGLNVVGPALKQAGLMAKPILKQARQQLVGVSPEIENVILTRADDVKTILDSADNIDDAVAQRWAEKAIDANTARYATIDAVKKNVDELIQNNALAGKKRNIKPLFDEIQSAKDKLSPYGKTLTKEIESEFASIADAESRLVNYVLDNAGVQIPEGALSYKELLKLKLPESAYKLNPLQLNEIKTTYYKSSGFAKQIGKTSAAEQLYESLGAITNKELDAISPLIRKENSKLAQSIKAQEKLKSFGLFDRGEFDPMKMRKISSVRDSARFKEVQDSLATLDEVWGTDLLDTALLTKAAKEIAPKDVLSSFQTGRSLFAPALGAVLGTVAGGPVGTAIGAVGGLALSSPAGVAAKIQGARAVESFLSGRAMQGLTKLGGKSGALIPKESIPFVSAQVAALSQLERSAGKVDREISSAFKSFAADAEQEDFETPTNLSALSNTNYGKGRVISSDDRQKSFSKRLDELRNIMINPETISGLMEQNLQGLSMVAPKVAEQMAMNASNAAMFLYNKAPKPPGNNALGLKQDWQPSDAQLASWERYVDAVENPFNVIKDLKQKRLSKEGVEALRVVYPGIYQKLYTKIAEGMNNKSMSYKDRLQLSSLLGIPVDNGLKPKSFMRLQQNYAQPQEQPSIGGSSSIQYANSRQTQAQRIEGR